MIRQCTLGSSLCKRINDLPHNAQCLILKEFIRDIKIPSERVQYFKALPDELRKALSPELVDNRLAGAFEIQKVNMVTKTIERSFQSLKGPYFRDKSILIEPFEKIYFYTRDRPDQDNLKRFFYYTVPSPIPTQGKYTNLVGHYLFDGIFLGGSNEKAMVVLEKRNDTYVPLNSYEVSNSFSKSDGNLEIQFDKLKGGYVWIKQSFIKSNLTIYGILDLWEQ